MCNVTNDRAGWDNQQTFRVLHQLCSFPLYSNVISLNSDVVCACDQRVAVEHHLCRASRAWRFTFLPVQVYCSLNESEFNMVSCSSPGLSNGPNANLLTIPKQRSSSVTLTYHSGPRRAGESPGNAGLSGFSLVFLFCFFLTTLYTSTLLFRHFSKPEPSCFTGPQPCSPGHGLHIIPHPTPCGVPWHSWLPDKT